MLDPAFASLSHYWSSSITACLPTTGPIINLAAMEYAQTVTPFVDASRLVVPKFFTISPKTGEPTFVVVHAKIARGAFARWLIRNRTSTIAALTQFDDLGYHFAQDFSRAESPTFVCVIFGGKGRSLRLQ